MASSSRYDFSITLVDLGRGLGPRSPGVGSEDVAASGGAPFGEQGVVHNGP